jgi:hypothetical protein
MATKKGGSKKGGTGKVRDAGTGEYDERGEATKRPKETVTEQDRPRPKPKK